MATPHINAPDNAFAQTVLMPGDPLRAKFIAETFLTDAKEVTNVRSMLGFTGYYQDQKISVMAHGMGIPSCSIYVTELIKFYNVKNIIRIGSCGAVLANVKVGDIIIGMGASTNSNVNRTRFNHADLAAIADYSLLSNAVNVAKQLNKVAKVGNLYTTDLFYNSDNKMLDYLEKYSILGVEMETAGIYAIANELKAKALAICTVSDHIRTGEEMNAIQRQTGFKDMIMIALETALLTYKE